MPDLLRLDDDRGRFAGLAAILVLLFVSSLSTRNPDWSAFVNLLLFGVPAAVILGLALARAPEAGPPPGWLSAKLVVGFVLTAGALFSLADLLGANTDDVHSSTITWIAVVLAGVFAFIARRRNSAICTLLAAGAAVVAVIAAVDWIFDPGGASTFRYVMLVEALVLVAAGVAIHRERGRHGVVLVVLSGLVVAALAGTLAFGLLGPLFGGGVDSNGIAWGWELVVLGFGLVLAGFAALTREPGPGYVAAALLSVFASLSAAGEESFVGWPLVLLLLLLAALAGMLRPGNDGRAGGPAAAGPGPGEDPTDVHREVRL